MELDSIGGGLAGAVALAIIAALSRWSERRDKARENTQTDVAAREERTFAQMMARVEELKSSLGKVLERCDRLEVEKEELESQRDKARLAAIDWEIEARKMAGALRRIAELEADVSRLRREVAELEAERDALEAVIRDFRRRHPETDA